MLISFLFNSSILDEKKCSPGLLADYYLFIIPIDLCFFNYLIFSLAFSSVPFSLRSLI